MGASACPMLLAAMVLGGCSGGSSPMVGAPTTGPAATSSASSNVAASPTAIGGSSVSTSIPASAWIQSSEIPLYATYHWTSPASTAKSARAPVLSAVQDCQLTLSGPDQAELGAFPAAQTDLSPTSGASRGHDDWAAQETILATDDTSSGDVQGIYNLYTDLVADLAKCAKAASGAKVSVLVSQGPEYAATITIPTSTGSTLTWHEYLAAPYGYLVELSVYVAPYSGDKPSAPWDGASARTVLSEIQSGPCFATKLC
jgi:hypothetical protein